MRSLLPCLGALLSLVPLPSTAAAARSGVGIAATASGSLDVKVSPKVSNDGTADAFDRMTIDNQYHGEIDSPARC